MARRSRSAPGHRPNKLTPDQVTGALERVASGETLASVARDLGVSPQAIDYHVRRALRG
jgi:DNA-binding NarL/FixJ family response regulator